MRDYLWVVRGIVVTCHPNYFADLARVDRDQELHVGNQVGIPSDAHRNTKERSLDLANAVSIKDAVGYRPTKGVADVAG